MKKIIRRTAVLAVVLVLIVGICAPAFAVYPSARLVTSSTRYVYRGRYLTARYYLKCGSYYYRYGYRSQLETAVFRAATGARYNFREVNYTGNGYLNQTYYVSYSMPRGRYNMRFRSFYRPYYYTYWRQCGRTCWWYMYIR